MEFFNKKRIYLDFASGSPLDNEVCSLMNKINRKVNGNANSLYKDGVWARDIINDSREQIASCLNAHIDEIIFTGSGTESDALAIIGIISNYESDVKSGKCKNVIPHIITTEIEHPAVLENCKMLEKQGRAEITYLKINGDGIISPKDLRDNIKSNTVLVSVMYANNEIGTIEPIEEISKEIRYYRKASKSKFPFFHTDATQAINYLPIDNIEKLGVDLMTFNGSKIYGPKGIGVLYKKRNVKINPIYSGGGQEFGLRSGTENVALIAGLSKALLITEKLKEKENQRLKKLRDYTIDKIKKLEIKPFGLIINGSLENRLPNNINISIDKMPNELLVVELDSKGIEISSRSACKNSKDDESYVIKALRLANEEAYHKEDGSLRITLGRGTKRNDMDKFVLSLNDILKKYGQWK